jgi:hypothetical protein
MLGVRRDLKSKRESALCLSQMKQRQETRIRKALVAVDPPHRAPRAEPAPRSDCRAQEKAPGVERLSESSVPTCPPDATCAIGSKLPLKEG